MHKASCVDKDCYSCGQSYEEMQDRVRELEEIETAYKLTLEQCAHEQKENARLSDRVKELEETSSKWQSSFSLESERYLEAEKICNQLLKVVDAARKHKENASHTNYIKLCEALRELDGEKKCGSCGMPDSDPKSVICNDGFHTPKD